MSKDSIQLLNIYATACYIQGYVSVAYDDDEHLNRWADRLIQAIEIELTDTGQEGDHHD